LEKNFGTRNVHVHTHPILEYYGLVM